MTELLEWVHPPPLNHSLNIGAGAGGAPAYLEKVEARLIRKGGACRSLGLGARGRAHAGMSARAHVGACGIEIVCAGHVTIDKRRDHKRLAEERRRRGPQKKTGARRRSGEL